MPLGQNVSTRGANVLDPMSETVEDTAEVRNTETEKFGLGRTKRGEREI